MVSIDSFQFDCSGLHLHHQSHLERAWLTSQEDCVWLYYFAKPPDLPFSLQSIELLRAFDRNNLASAGSAIVEHNIVLLDGCDALKMIFKSPQKPSGMTYVGSLVLPFRDFSFVLKIQCEENGITGLREAEILNRMIESNDVEIDFKNNRIKGWSQDPYDPQFVAPLLRNKAEEEIYDTEFPQHPLSRIRWLLNHYQGSVRVRPEAKSQPRFSGPVTNNVRNPWWAIWR